jgi:hypothetical protein
MKNVDRNRNSSFEALHITLLINLKKCFLTVVLHTIYSAAYSGDGANTATQV